MSTNDTDELGTRIFKELIEVLTQLGNTADPSWLKSVKGTDQFVVDLEQIDKWLVVVTRLRLLAASNRRWQYFVDIADTTLDAMEGARDLQKRRGAISSNVLMFFRNQMARLRVRTEGFDPGREARIDADTGRHSEEWDRLETREDSRTTKWEDPAPRSPARIPRPNMIGPPRERNGRHYRVWFGTDRAREIGEEVSFGVNWSEKLTLGSCDVYVPTTHKFASIGSSWIVRKVKGLFGIEDDRLRLEATRILGAAKFGESVGRELKKSKSSRTALVYVHGYNVSFEEAAIRAAQIGVDLRVEGITAFFSWPSKGALIPYASDEANIDLAENHFVAFLEQLSHSANLQEIDILAHSMGNRLLCRTIDRLVKARSSGALRVPIGHIVLAAADLTADFFMQYVHQYKQLAKRRVTNYASGRDLALWASQLVHGIARVGLTPPVFTHEDLDTISVSGFNLDLLGHGYFASAEALLYDISSLIRTHMEPDRRQRMLVVPSGASRYWVLHM